MVALATECGLIPSLHSTAAEWRLGTRLTIRIQYSVADGLSWHNFEHIIVGESIGAYAGITKSIIVEKN